MADDADRAEAQIERVRMAGVARAHALASRVVARVAACLWCEREWSDGRRWCDAECRDAFEAANLQQRQLR